MNAIRTVIASLSISAGLLIEWLYGGFHVNLQILMALMVFDLIGGVISAMFGSSSKSKTGKLSSREMMFGIFRKVWVLVNLSVAHLADVFLGINYLYNMVAIAFISREILSIIEKYALIVGEPPDALKKILDVLEDKENA